LFSAKRKDANYDGKKCFPVISTLRQVDGQGKVGPLNMSKLDKSCVQQAVRAKLDNVVAETGNAST